MLSRSLAAVALVALAGVSSSTIEQTASGLDQVRRIHERALASPFDEAAFDAFLESLPRDGEYYVLEGDIPATESEVREYLVGRAGAQSRAGIKPELIANLQNGRPDYYADPAKRTLPYYVDPAGWSESEAQTIRVAMSRATTAWQEVCPECGIAFKAVETPPREGDRERGFVVRRADTRGAYIAVAFFPHEVPARRELRLDPTFFTSGFDSIGVLRHELGHVLGYRHEHIRGIPGCAFEADRWKPLTRYDPHSVMHYLCGGGGSLSLNITQVDAIGHRALYAPPRDTRAGFAPPPPRRSVPAAEAQALFEDAREHPFDATKKAAFLASLPRAGNYYVIEGDMRMTEDEVTEYLAGSRGDTRAVQQSPELLVNLHVGQPDFYAPDERTLTYLVQRDTFPTPAMYDQAAAAMASATAQWESLCHGCGIKFVALDGRSATPNFTVRYFDAGGDFIAASFFPHDPPARRQVDLDPSFFTTTFDRVGVLRHELGHVMGYRHEHIRNVPGCYREDKQWRPLTAYDPHSVMHYFCGGGGSMKLDFTETDRAGHSSLYQLPTAAAPRIEHLAAPVAAAPNAGAEVVERMKLARAPRRDLSEMTTAGAVAGTAGPETAPGDPALLVVSLEGGNVVDNAAAVLNILHRNDALPLTEHVIGPSETVEAIYRRELGLPSFSAPMGRVAAAVNKRDLARTALQPGDLLVHPKVRFVESVYGVRADTATVKRIEKKWDDLVIGKTQAPPGETNQSERIQLRRFELRLPIAETRTVERVREQIDALGSRNIVVTVESPAPARIPPSFSIMEPPTPPTGNLSTPESWIQHRDAATKGEQASLLSILGPKAFKSARRCTPRVNCPEVVLVDKRVSVHPDLRGAVIGDNVDLASQDRPMVLQDDRQVVEIVEWNERFHGTHLAGLVAAQDNDFGLVGINPDAQVRAWDATKLESRPTEFAQDVVTNQTTAATRGSMQMYVFATGWSVGPYRNRQQRVTKDIRAKRLYEERALVIAAAGQVPDGEPYELDADMQLAPMNLGDFENVLTVTACRRCGGPNARLLDEANYSPTFVHVAAPGVNILSTADNGCYAVASGTSQAAALVAGLASAMVSRFPDQLREAYQVKTRIEVTSQPIEFLGSSDQGKLLATGVIDPMVATLDPAADWLKQTGTDWQKIEDPEHESGVRWRSKVLSAVDEDGKSVTIVLQHLWRLTRSGDRWIVYAAESRRGPVQKIGPLTFRPDDQSEALFRFKGKDMRLAGVEDLLLRFPSSRP